MIWNFIAKVVSKPAVRDWLIRRAMKTPYTHIMKGDDVYMERYWLFNPYELHKPDGKTGWRRRFPSIRLHKILLPDQDRHLHSHPWDCRTIILSGEYTERRLHLDWASKLCQILPLHLGKDVVEYRQRRPGSTATLDIHDYHSIDAVSSGGVWTLFITWKYQGTWGFLVNGKKVPWREYLGL